MSPPLSPCHGFGEADSRRMEEQKRTSDLLASALDTIRPYNYITVNLSSISDSSEGEGDVGGGDKPVTPRQVTSKPQIGTGSSSRPKMDEMPTKAMGPVDDDTEEGGGGANAAKTPVSLLQELYVRRGLTPKYDLVQIEGAVHEPTFKYRVTIGEFVATGCGQSKKKAKHSAAKVRARPDYQ